MRNDEMAARVEHLELEVGAVKDLALQLNHKVDQLLELVGAVNHRSQLLDEIAHLTHHLDHGFNQVRDQVEIISALTLSLQRQAERQGLLPEAPAGSA